MSFFHHVQCRCKLHHTNSSFSKSNGNGDTEEILEQGKVQPQPPLCSPDLRISQTNEYSQQPFIHFVRDSAYAFAYALHNMHLKLCGGLPGICSAMSHIDGPHLIEYLKNVTFKGDKKVYITNIRL
jgi:hypothetical protein